MDKIPEIKISYNKAFKRDSQCLAVLVQSLAYVFMPQCLSLGGIALSPLNAALSVLELESTIF